MPMSKSAFSYVVILFKGMAMGAADVVPGVSGGTIAFISGIYEELIETIDRLDFGVISVWKKEGFKKMFLHYNLGFYKYYITCKFNFIRTRKSPCIGVVIFLWTCRCEYYLYRKTN
jgi:uncharacterized membrane protein